MSTHGSAHDVPAKVISMAINGSGVRDTGRVLGISPNTVTNILRSQADKIKHVHPDIEQYQGDKNAQIQLCLADLEAEMDEQWSFVQSKKTALALVRYRPCNLDYTGFYVWSSKRQSL